MIVITALALAWVCLFFFQIGISLFLFYTYYLDKDKRKLIFGMGFLISSYAHIYQAISLESNGSEIAIFNTLYYWSVLPLLFSISSAVHESLLPFKFERRIDIIYFLSVVISLLLIIGLPLPERITYVFIASLFTIELLLATLYVIIKNRRLTDVYFFISVVLLGIGGISLGGMFEQPFSLLALSLGFLFIGIAFYSSKEKEIDSPSKISHYFTLRKQLDNAKKALNETEEKYRHIALSSSDLIAMLSFSIPPKYTYVSPSHKRIMGYDEKDLLGKNALSFVHPDDKLNLLPILRNYLAHKTKKVYKNSSEKPEETLEFRIRDKNGNWHYLESKANIAGNQILLISRDITKRKNTEIELLKTKAFLEASINQSSAGILIADAPDVNIRYANPAALGIRGGKKKNLTEISLKEHVNQWQTYYPDGTVYKPEDLPLSRAILKGEIVNDEEVIIRNTDGVDRYVLANAAPVKNECGEIIAGVVVFSDITELKKSLDKERIYQQNLIELNKNAFNMLKKSTLDEMYTYIGNTLTEIIDDAIIIIGNYNEKQNQVTVKNLFGVKQNSLQKLLQILKVNPIGKTYELREDIKDLYSEQKIVEIKGGLQGLSKKMYSSFAIKKIEHLLNLKKIYTIGLRRQNQLFAWIHIFKFNQPELKNKELVEAFLSQSSLILQRKFYEEKNKDLANIVTQSDDAIIQTDLSFEIIYINPKAEELYGYTSREVIGKTPELFNAEPAAPELQKKIYDTVSKGGTFSGEHLNQRKNGSTFWCQMKISPLVNQQGKIYGYMSSQRDITEQKNAQEEQNRLHEKSLFLSKTANELQRFSVEQDVFDYMGLKIQELAGNCLIVLSLYDQNKGEFQIRNTYGNLDVLNKASRFLNIDFTSFTAFAKKDFVQNYLFADTLRKLPQEELEDTIHSLFPKGSFLFAQKMFNTNEVYIMGLKEEDILYGSVTIVAHKDEVVENTDVIETFLNQASVALQRNHAMKELSEINKNLEEKVKERTEEIQRLLKQKDEFINQLGHDLKNPLGPLLNLIPIVEGHTQNPKDKRILQVTQRNVNYMKNLVQKTLELARLNSPNATFSKKPINIKHHIQESLERNSLMFDEKQITVNTSIPDDLIVYADQLRLEELFNNLLNNAVKYNKQRGTITIEVFRKEDFVTISVQDDGIGMTSDQLDHVFDEFYKADESRHDFDSSGLGMPICKRIVEKHGGKIWAESEGIGMGTTFYFTLPTVPSQTQFEGNTPSGDSEDDYRESISEKVDRILEKR